jgi:hypothetical protein
MIPVPIGVRVWLATGRLSSETIVLAKERLRERERLRT